MKKLLVLIHLIFIGIGGFAQNVDPNYGVQGVTSTAFNSTDDMWCVSAQQSDGKTLVAGFVASTGELAVARYLINGQLDVAFSGDGKFTFQTGFAVNAVPKLDISILTNGKILVMICDYNNRFYLLKLTTVGVPDPTFLTNGFTTFSYQDFPGTLIRNIHSIKIQLDGKILVAGRGRMTNSTDGFLVARILSNGYTLDNSFSGDGVLVFDPYQYGSEAKDLILQSDGSLIVGGNAKTEPAGSYSYCISKLSSSGSQTLFPGSNYGTAAYTYGNFGKFVQQSDGKIVIMGDYAGGVNVRLLRVLATSAIDYSFGTLGYAGINWIVGANDLNAGKGISILNNGQILVAGTLYRSSGNVARMTRLNANGTTDLTFGNQGIVSGIFGTGSVQCNSMQMLPDGTAILTGSKKNGTKFDMAITRWFLKCTKFKTINKNLCGNEIYYYNNQPFSQAGTYLINIPGASCDSSVTLNIATFPDVVPAVTISSGSSMPICAGSPVSFQANVQNGGTNPTYAWQKNFTTVSTSAIYTTSNLVSGDQISLNITSNHPCAATPFAGSNYIDITTANPPTASVSQNGNQLSCPATIGAQYQWLDCNNGNATIPGATTRNFNPGQSGSFAIRITKGNCIVTSACFPFVFTSILSIDENPGEFLFPNPAADKISVRLSSPEGLHFHIFDAFGRIVLEGILDASQPQIQINSIATGVYTLIVKSKGVHRFVKE